MPHLVFTALGSGAEALGARGRGRVSARRHGLSSSCTTSSNRKHQPSPSQANEDALVTAAFKGNLKEVLRLLDKGVNKDSKDDVYILLFPLLR